MSSVYVVTRGEYSDYCIEAIFTNQEAAEKYCAVQSNGRGNDPMIEEWNASDGTDIKCVKVYRAIFFIMNDNGKLSCTDMRYSDKPIPFDIRKNRSEPWCNIRGISGYIPVNKSIEDAEVIKKIVYDQVAKWKARLAGL